MANGPTVGVFTRGTRLSRNKARFSGQVDAWVQKSKARMNYVHREATWRTVWDMQMMAPLLDGFLRASLTTTVNSRPPPANKDPAKDMAVSRNWNSEATRTAIYSTEAGDKVINSYTVVYAKRLEYGFTGYDSIGRFYNQPPRAWVRLASQNWKSTVSEVVKAAKAAVR